MDRTLWSQSFGEYFIPHWPCPECHHGHIELIPKGLHFEETEQSKRWRTDEHWEPDWIRYIFSAWARCSNKFCKEPFAIAGTGTVIYGYTEEGDYETFPSFEPHVCVPMPDIIAIPAKCPDAVALELRSAFALFWKRREACAGRIRVSLELLLDYLKLPRRFKAKNGKFSDMSLHARLEVLSKSAPIIGVQLMALKWLGNSGSHSGEVSRDDLLDAFEILEHALAELLEQKSERIAALAKKMTAKHGK